MTQDLEPQRVQIMALWGNHSYIPWLKKAEAKNGASRTPVPFRKPTFQSVPPSSCLLVIR